MIIGIGLGVSFPSRPGVALPAIVAAGTISGGAKIGSAQSVTGFSATGADSTAYSWRANGVEVATTANFTPGEALDGQSLVGRTIATNTAGSVYADTPAVTITYQAPSKSGDLAAVDLTQSVAMSAAVNFASVVSVSGDADLSGMTWGIAPSSEAIPTGLARSGATIPIATPTTISAPRSIVLRGSNSGGYVDVACPIAVRPANVAAWWSLALASSIKMATAGTGGAPAAAADPVGYVADLSGSGFHLASSGGDSFRLAWGPGYARKAASSNRHVLRNTVAINQNRATFSVVAAFKIASGTPGAQQPIFSINDGATSGATRLNLRLDTDGHLKVLIRRADGGSSMTIDGGACPTDQIVVATVQIDYASNTSSLQINTLTAVSGGAMNGTAGASSANTASLGVGIGTALGASNGPAQTLDIYEVAALNSASATAVRDYMLALYAPVAAIEARAASVIAGRVGISSHYSWNGTNYDTLASTITSRIIEAGIKIVRDRWDTWASDAAQVNTLVAAGIKFDLVTEQNASYPYATVKAALDNWPGGSILAVEGHNEPSDASWTASFQTELFDGLRADSDYNNTLILGPSLISSSVANSIGGSIAAKIDRLNIHPYAHAALPEPRESDGYTAYGFHIAFSAQLDPTAEVWITEAGYHNYTAGASAIPGNSEAASAIYGPRSIVYYLTHPTLNIGAYMRYEILDNLAQPAGQERNFGLLYSDGSRKPEFYTTKALLTTIADTGGSAGTVRAALSGANSRVYMRALKRSDGKIDLLLWNAKSVWDTSTKTDVTVVDVTETITLGDAWASAQVLKVADGASAAFASVTIAANTITLPVGPNISIVRLTP